MLYGVVVKIYNYEINIEDLLSSLFLESVSQISETNFGFY